MNSDGTENIAAQDFWIADNDLHILDKTGKELVFTEIQVLDVSGGEPMGDAVKVEAIFTKYPYPES